MQESCDQYEQRISILEADFAELEQHNRNNEQSLALKNQQLKTYMDANLDLKF